jgi:hypothetical protein
MELDATQTALSKEERERRRRDKLCFRCGKPGHMSKDCKQKPKEGQQYKNKQLRATAEFCATRGAYDTTGAMTPKKRSNERLRKLFKECTTLDDDEIEQELREEDSTEYGSAKSDWPAETPSMLAATNQESPTSDGYSSIEWENVTPEELVRKWTTLTNDEIDRTIGSDKEKTDHEEPDQEDFPAIDWTTIDRPIDPLDEEYGTQWVSLTPKKEQPHEIPETPQDNSPKDDDEADRYAAWLRQPDRKQLAELEAHQLNARILSKVKQGVKGCTHWNLECWDQAEPWEVHEFRCDKHPPQCRGCRQWLNEYFHELRRVSVKRLPGPYHGKCDYTWCLCKHFRGHPKHHEVLWIACYSNNCEIHHDNKYVAQYWPQVPIIVKENDTCPCWKLECPCRGYRKHPEHDAMHWTACFEEQCIVHYQGKLEGGRFPTPPNNLGAPRWAAKGIYLAATEVQRGRHLRLQARILSQPTQVMVDSGATGNYMNPGFMKKLGLLGKAKAVPEPIAGLNGENLGTLSITTESGTVPMVVLGHVERLNFDIIPTGRYDVVLGIPWLKNHNPAIDWKTGSLQFNCKCPRQDQSQGESGTLRRVRSKGIDDNAKRLRGEPRKAATGQRATTAVLAAIKPLQRMAMMELPGWAPEQDSDYADILTPDDISEFSQDEIPEETDSESERTWDHGPRPRTALAATQTQDTGTKTNLDLNKLPQEYHGYRILFEQPKQYTLPKHGRHDHKIPLKEGTSPACKKLYQLSEKETPILKEYIDKELSFGKIRPSKSPAGHGLLFVPKKDGSLRPCIDYRPLNAITIKDRYPLPLIHEIQDQIRGAKWFTKLDITDAYNHIRIADGEEWKTAFRTKFGHFEYLVMPFGLTNAPASFQRFINEVLQEYLHSFVIAYLDDILIFSKEKEEHVQHVSKVLKKLQEANIKLKLKKCEFHVQETEFLGHWISAEGIHMDQNKVNAILEWPQPENVKQVQQFIGLVNYYRRFIGGYAGIMHSLFALLKKEKEFGWDEGCDKAFKEVKQRIASAPILVQSDPEKEKTLETDASDYAIGMRLTQPGDDGKPRPIAFYSRKLIQAELNYDIHDKELLAIVVAFKVWRVYLEGAKHTIIVKTDHKNLTFFTTTKELTRRQARWAETLSQFDFKIVHCKGTENGQADALSRRPDYEIQGKTIEPAILRQQEDGSLTYNHHTLAATIELNEDPLIQEIAEATKKRQNHSRNA